MNDRFRYAWRVFSLWLFRTPYRTAVMFLLPVLITAVFLLLPQRARTAPVEVGVALTDESGAAFWELLSTYSGETVTFLLSDAGTIEQNVSLARWDCGLVIGADFDARVRKLDTDGLLTLIISDGSAVYPLVRETAAACLARCTAPYIAEEYLASHDMSGAVDLPFSERVDIHLQVLDGGTLTVREAANEAQRALLFTILFAAASFGTLFAGAELARWLTGGAGRMERRLRGAALCVLPRFFALLCPPLLGLAAAWAMLL